MKRLGRSMTRRRARRFGCNALYVLICAPIAGAMAIGGDLAFILLSPWLTRAMSAMGWTNRSTSDVSVDLFDDPLEALLFMTFFCVLGLIATVLALAVVGPWYQRKPRWTRAISMMLPALAIAALPWISIVVTSECAAWLYDPNQQEMQVLRLVYVFGGPIFALLSYRLARGGLREWKLHRSQGHIPREPCKTCGYELRQTTAWGGLKRCPECGTEQPVENSPAEAKNADF